eukprot:m.265117 g.265117  ORF g.265117 m.265117 type:complete len:70 (-) comp29293_c0_seq1:372-581(-)
MSQEGGGAVLDGLWHGGHCCEASGVDTLCVGVCEGGVRGDAGVEEGLAALVGVEGSARMRDQSKSTRSR